MKTVILKAKVSDEATNFLLRYQDQDAPDKVYTFADVEIIHLPTEDDINDAIELKNLRDDLQIAGFMAGANYVINKILNQ